MTDFDVASNQNFWFISGCSSVSNVFQDYRYDLCGGLRRRNCGRFIHVSALLMILRLPEPIVIFIDYVAFYDRMRDENNFSVS